MPRTVLTAILSAAFAFFGAPATGQQQQWIRQFGTSQSEWARALCPDGSGGVFMCGDSLGGFGGPSAGQSDAWLARHDGEGNRLWVRQSGTVQDDYARSAASDSTGGVFVGGSTFGSFGGATAGGFDAWLSRYDSDGTRLWIRQFGTSSGESVETVCVDGAGGAFVAGSTGGTLGAPFAGGDADAFVARYDSNGSQLWIRQLGTSAAFGDFAFAAAPDNAGGVFVAGRTNGSLGGPSAGNHDAWLARYDSGGSQLWIRQFGTNLGDSASACAPDGAGGVYVAGSTRLNLGGPSAGNFDGWVAQYDNAGNQLWIGQFGTAGIDEVAALASNGASGVHVAGWTTGSFGGHTNAGGQDAFVARFHNGSLGGMQQVGSSSSDIASSVAPDGAGGVFVAGSTDGSLGGPSAGGSDAWIARYSRACYPDCNADGALNLADFGCFQSKFALQDPYADCNGDGALSLADFGCFQTKFALGCP